MAIRHTFFCVLSTNSWYASICLSSFFRDCSVFSTAEARGTPCCLQLSTPFFPRDLFSVQLTDIFLYLLYDPGTCPVALFWTRSVDRVNWRRRQRRPNNTAHMRTCRFLTCNRIINLGPLCINLEGRYPIRSFFELLVCRVYFYPRSSSPTKTSAKSIHIRSYPSKSSSSAFRRRRSRSIKYYFTQRPAARPRKPSWYSMR